jgi:xylulokinase
MTGNIAFVGFTAPKLLWLKHNEPDNFAKISKVMLPKDYLLYISSGVFASDVSDNSGTLYFDVRNKCWQQDMLTLLGINTSQLPQIFESYDCIGTVSAIFAQETGLSRDTRIVAGGGDNAVGAIGTGTIGDGRVNLSLGTSGIVFASCNQYTESVCKGLHNFAHSDGHYHFMGCTLACAASVDFWLKSILCTTDYTAELLTCEKINPNDILFLPYISGERSPINDPNAKGVFYGISISHTRADMTVAVVEGICFALKDCLTELNAIGIKPKIATLIGGLSRNPWVCQLLANILNIQINLLQSNEGGAYGAVILAMVGDGLYPNVAKACECLIKPQSQILPDQSRVDFYNTKFGMYKRLYNQLKSMT